MKGLATRVWVVGIPVANFDRSMAFYRDLLGFKVQLEARMFNWIELGPDEPLCKIGLAEVKGNEKGRKPGGATGITLDTDDIQEFHRRLTTRGVKFTLPPSRQPWGGMMGEFLDPDGNELTIVEDPEHYVRKVPMLQPHQSK